MATVVFEDGTKVQFEGTPTPQDIEDAASHIKTGLTSSTDEQKAGSIPTREGLKSLLPTKEQIPELVGTVGAGLLAAGKSSPIGIAATGAGAQIGEIANQARQAITGDNPPTSIGESLKRQGLAFARGAGSEAGGRLIGKLLTPFAGSVTPEIKTQVQAAERAGVAPPLSAMTTSPKVQALERSAEYGIFGTPITAQKQQAVKQLGDFADKISNGIGPDTPPELVGEMAKSKIKNFEEVFKKAKNALYEPINSVLNDKPVNPENTIAAIKQVIDQKAGGKEGQGLLKDWLDRLKPDTAVQATATKESIDPLSGQVIKYQVPATKKIINQMGQESTSQVFEKGNPTFKVLKAIRTEIGSRGKFNDPGVTGIKSQLEGIYAAATKDMDNLATQHGMGDALDAVNAQYSTGIKKLQNSLLQAANARAEKSPETLHKLFIRQDSPTLIKTGKEILGEDGFNQVRKQWFDDLVNRSKSIVEGEEIVSPTRLANNIRKTGSSLDEITAGNPELAQKLSDLSDVSKLLTRGNKVTQGSQTGFILSDIKDVMRMLAAPLVRTDTGREFLTTGFPTIGKFATRIAQTGGQLGLQKVSQ